MKFYCITFIVCCFIFFFITYKLDLHFYTERHKNTPNVCCHIAVMDLLYF